MKKIPPLTLGPQGPNLTRLKDTLVLAIIQPLKVCYIRDTFGGIMGKVCSKISPYHGSPPRCCRGHAMIFRRRQILPCFILTQREDEPPPSYSVWRRTNTLPKGEGTTSSVGRRRPQPRNCARQRILAREQYCKDADALLENGGT